MVRDFGPGARSIRAPSAHDEVEHGGLCSALMKRWIRFDSWHLDHHGNEETVVVQGGLAEAGKAAVSKTVVGVTSAAQVRILHPPQVASSTG